MSWCLASRCEVPCFLRINSICSDSALTRPSGIVLDTRHAFCRLRRTVITEKESPTGLQEIRNILDIPFEVVEKHLENMQDRIWTSNLELGELAVESDILFELSALQQRKTLMGRCSP